MDKITMEDLAAALLYDGARSMEDLARCMSVDTESTEEMNKFTAEVRSLMPDIEDWLGGGGEAGVALALPRENRFPPGSVIHDLFEGLKDGEWRDMGYIQMFMRPAVGAAGRAALDKAMEVLSNPWDAENLGRALLLRSLDRLGLPLYRLEFSVPWFVMRVCETVWGELPRSHPAVDDSPQGNEGDLPTQDRYARR